MGAREEIRAALMEMPVSWLHMPALAAGSGTLPGPKGEPPQPKVIPVLAAAALGVAAGAGIQLAHQYLNKQKGVPPITADVGRIACSLTIKELEDNATQVYEDSLQTKDGGQLKAIVDSTSGGAKVFPVVAAVFLAGVAAGAAAARP
ncbi:MAG: hypothetical protein WA418_10420 [Bradyrhizobium sp.]